MSNPLSRFTVGDTIIQFDHAPGLGPVQLSLRPKNLPPVEHREFLPDEVEIRNLPEQWRPARAWALDSLVQLKCLEDNQTPGFRQGRTMRQSLHHRAERRIPRCGRRPRPRQRPQIRLSGQGRS